MASGHEYRANRPNTWLLRPLLQSEDSSCQPGAVHTWPEAVVAACLLLRRCGGLDETGPDAELEDGRGGPLKGNIVRTSAIWTTRSRCAGLGLQKLDG